MRKNSLIIFILIIGFALNIFAQQKKIESSEYYIAIQKAEYNTQQASRREKRTFEEFSDGVGKIVKTELEEFLLPDKKHYILTEKEDNKTTKLELIQLGKNFYQKKDDGKWTKEKSWGKQEYGVFIPLPEIQEYSIENVKDQNLTLKLYRYYAVYFIINPKEDEEKQRFWEQKTWINSKGVKVKEEIYMGKPASKRITYRRFYEIEYTPKIIIRAPVK